MEKRGMSFLKEEEGFILIIALLILFLLTVLGISATNTTSLELQVALNDSIHKQNFYRAEAANLEGMQKASKIPASKMADSADIDKIRKRDPATWTKYGIQPDNPDIKNDTLYIVVKPLVMAGGSVDYTKEDNLVKYHIFGRYSTADGAYRGDVIVETAYSSW
jgi:hypothetical protein